MKGKCCGALRNTVIVFSGGEGGAKLGKPLTILVQPMFWSKITTRKSRRFSA